MDEPSQQQPERENLFEKVITFDRLDNTLVEHSVREVILPWRNKSNAVVFQQGKRFEALLKAYNANMEDGKGNKTLKSKKMQYNFHDVSILEYLPDSVANYIENMTPVRVRSRLEVSVAVVDEIEEVHGFSACKFKPIKNVAFSLDFPDSHFYADRTVNLRFGKTAYKLVEPLDNNRDRPVIVCLHGLLDCSYIWSDLADVLARSEDGPRARVLMFDFHGHGRSPWTGVPNSLDILVAQLKEILDALELLNNPVSILGYCLGGAVGVGFAARYPGLCKSLSMIAPIGIKTSFLGEYKVYLQPYCFGELVFLLRKYSLPDRQKNHYFNSSERATHWPLVQKQIAMIQYQLQNTTGYLGALLSTYREFPFRLEELMSVVGLHSRPVLIIWGDRDTICPYKSSIHRIEACFPNAFIADIRNCGHNAIFEKYNEVAMELIDFLKCIESR